MITAVCWETQYVINRRHFIRSLVPNSLADMLSTPSVGRCLAEHKEDLRHALVKGQPALTNILHKILDHLREHPPPLPCPTQSPSIPGESPRPSIAPPGSPPQKPATSTSPLPPSQHLCLGKKSPARKKDIHLPIPSSNLSANANPSETYRQYRPATVLKIPRAKNHRPPTPVEVFFLFVHYPKSMRSRPTEVTNPTPT